MPDRSPLIRSSLLLRSLATAVTLSSLASMTAFAATHVQNEAAPLKPAAPASSTTVAATALGIPPGLPHVIALLLDPYAKVGLIDLFVPFLMPYGAFAIGLGTVSLQLVFVVIVAAWSRTRLSRGQWLAFHRLSYLAFAAAFLHGVLSGTDLAYPWLLGTAWLVAAILVMAGARRIRHALAPRQRQAVRVRAAS